MAVNYMLQFGTGDPRSYTGINATFLVFKDVGGNNVTAPGITEVPSGTGLYYFTWGTSNSIFFLADAATTSPGAAGRYIAGNLDPTDRMSEIGTSLAASNASLTVGQNRQGTTLVGIGNTSIAFGTSIYALEQAIGNTLLALGAIGISINGLIGTTASFIGDNVTPPVDLFGYLKRIRQLHEGNQTFIKVSGVQTQLDSTGTTTLYSKTISNNASLVTKT